MQLRILAAAVLVAAACSRPAGPAKPREFVVGAVPDVRGAAASLLDGFCALQARPPANVVELVDTRAALDAVRSGRVEVACVGQDLGPEELKGLVQYPFAREPLVFAARRGSGATDISTAQVQALYRGDLRNWAVLGGPDSPVALLDRPLAADFRKPLSDVLPAGLQPVAASVFERQDQLDAVLAEREGAFGLTTLRTARAIGDVLRLDGDEPGAQSLRCGTYKLARTLTLVARADSAPGAKALFDFVAAPVSRQALEAALLVPLRRELRLAVPPARNIVTLELRYGPLARYLEEHLGRPVELAHEPTYEDLVQGFRTGRIDAAFLGSFACVASRIQSGVEVVARPEYPGGSTYRGVIYVRRESPYWALADLGGRRIALSGRHTLAGHLFPLFALRSRGLGEPERFFAKTVQAESHEAALAALLEGRVEAAAAKDLVYEELVKEDPGARNALRALAASPPVPNDGVGVAPLLGASVRGRIRGLLLAMDRNPQGAQVLKAMGCNRFVETTDSDYSPVYAMLSRLSNRFPELTPCR